MGNEQLSLHLQLHCQMSLSVFDIALALCVLRSTCNSPFVFVRRLDFDLACVLRSRNQKSTCGTCTYNLTIGSS
jgi:hypothetical protein